MRQGTVRGPSARPRDGHDRRPPCRAARASRRDQCRDRDELPGQRAGVAAVRSEQHCPRARARRPNPAHVAVGRGSAAVAGGGRTRRRSARTGRRPPGRLTAACRDREGAFVGRARVHLRRADGGAHPGRGRAALLADRLPAHARARDRVHHASARRGRAAGGRDHGAQGRARRAHPSCGGGYGGHDRASDGGARSAQPLPCPHRAARRGRARGAQSLQR